MASFWDTLVDHVRNSLPDKHTVNSAGEAIFHLPFDTAGFLGDLPFYLSNIPSTVREGRDLIKGDRKAAKREVDSQYKIGDGPATRLANKAHDAIHQDTAAPQTKTERYVDAALRGGPGGLAGEAAEQNLPDTWWKPIAVSAAELAGNLVPIAGAHAVRGKAPLVLTDEDLRPTREAPLAPDGLPGNGTVRPMDPREIAAIMNDPEAAGIHGINDNVPHRRMNNRDLPEGPEVIHPEDLGEISLVQDEQPAPSAQAAANEALAPQEAPEPTTTPPEADNVHPFPDVNPATDEGFLNSIEAKLGRGEVPTDDEFARLKAMHDATSGQPDVILDENSDPVVNRQEVAPNQAVADATQAPAEAAPANDVSRLDAAKNFLKNLMADESGVLGYKKDAPEENPYPESFYKLAQALRQGVPARNKQEGMYHAEMQKKVAELAKAREAGSGIEGFHAELGTLKGKLPTVQDYEGMSGLSQADLNELFNHIRDHPKLGWLQSINAREGLSKILQGEVPTRSEITYLARTMPPELIRELLKNKSLWSKIMEGAVSTLNVPKALMASYDVSAPLRQGVLMIGRKEFWTALVPMIRAFASPKYANEVREGIYRDALYPVMSDSGLAIPVYENHNGGPMLLEEHEEPFMTDLAGKIPLVGIGVKASERAYNTFVYKVRADTFRSIYDTAREGGKSWDKDSLKSLSRFINTFTGRGDLGRFNNMAPALNIGFFSPRLMKSRLDTLNVLPGGFYHEMDPYVRKEAFKSLASFVAIAATVMGLAKFAGAEVGADPRQADGWKIKLGNTRYDILGGEQQLIRLMGNIATYTYQKSKEIANTGEIHTGYKEKTAVDNIGQFLRNKESPDVSLGHDFYAGNTAVGEPFSPKAALEDRITPMSAGDAYDVYEDQIKQGIPQDKALAKALVMASPGLLGASVSTYEPHAKKPSNKQFSKEFSKEFSGEFKKEKF
jgi:hypothetical protein